MGNRRKIVFCLFAGVALLTISGCTTTYTRTLPTTTYTIGGTVSGLAGTGLVLEYSGNNLAVTANGNFTFTVPQYSGFSYNVKVLTPPSSPALQTCTVTNGYGIANANVTNIQVACTTNANPTPIPTPTLALNDWTWVGGVSALNQPGWYGTMGVAAAINSPGARVNASTWTDASGNLWLFGGNSPAGVLNDLWEFTGNQWMWVGGSNASQQPGVYGTMGTAATGNIPGARREAVSWTDATGNFWLFGGKGFDSAGTYGRLNDLWKYSAGQWTWMNGASTVAASKMGVYGTKGTTAAGDVPGAREDANSWTDPSGNMWLFGGLGYDSAGALGILNDLWKYSAGQWTWVSGANTVNQFGVYGTMGTAAAGNVPGSRTNAVTWTDATGYLWLFGGQGNDWNGKACLQNNAPCFLSDLWKYGAGQWTWVGGPNIVQQTGVYGTMGTAAAGNIPGSRSNAVGWVDATGNFWLFGGWGFDSTTGSYTVYGDLNDLWKYSAGQWTWVGGASGAGQAGSYGTLGVAVAGNVPPSRESAVGWVDKFGNFWLFGGSDYNAIITGGKLNDLWVYQP